MMFGFPAEPYELDPVMVRALDQLLILHADHEQNCSTSTVRMVGSAAGEPVRLGLARASTPCRARCTAAPTRRCWRCSRRSRPTAATSPSSSRKVKDKEDGVRLMGFGHRVYKNYDPRARDHQADRRRGALEKLGKRDDLLDIAHGAGGARAERRLLRRAQALPERRLLLGPHLPGAWASRPRCSRCCSRSAGCPAGSPSGTR